MARNTIEPFQRRTAVRRAPAEAKKPGVAKDFWRGLLFGLLITAIAIALGV